MLRSTSNKIVRLVSQSNFQRRLQSTRGVIYTWGGNRSGECGHNSKEDIFTPKRVEFFEKANMKQICLGGSHAIAVSDEGFVFTWGRNKEGQLGVGDNLAAYGPLFVKDLQDIKIKSVAAGEYHSAAVAEDGNVYTWGYNKTFIWGVGSLGHQSTGPSVRSPKIIPFFRDANIRIKQVSCGTYHSAAVSEDGRLFTWGKGDWGRLGLGDGRNHVEPQEVAGFEGRVKSVSCGASHSVFITEDGKFWVFGRNDHLQLGIETSEQLSGGSNFDAEQIPRTLDDFSAVKMAHAAGGHVHTAACSQEGLAFFWGNRRYTRPVRVQSLENQNVVQAACGGRHIFFLTDVGKLFALGRSSRGELGIGPEDKSEKKEATQVKGFKGKKVVQVAAGKEFSAAIVLED